MGRSGNSKKTSLVHQKTRGLLLGGQNVGMKELEVIEIIPVDLKKRIEMRIDSSSSDLISREYFYEDILDELRKFDPKDLLKDPTFLKILNHDARFIERDSGVVLTDKQIQYLASQFAESIASGQIPNLGRELFASSKFDFDFKKQIFSGYLASLFSKRKNDASFNQFLFSDILTLLEKADQETVDHGLLLLPFQISLSKSADIEAYKILPNISEPKEKIYKKREAEIIEKYIKLFLERCLDDKNNYTVKDFEQIITSSKIDAGTEAVLTEVAEDSNLIVNITGPVFKPDETKQKLDYLDSLLSRDNILNREPLSVILETVYLKLGGEQREINAGRSLSSGGIYRAIEATVKAGVFNKNYDYPAGFLLEIDRLIN